MSNLSIEGENISFSLLKNINPFKPNTYAFKTVEFCQNWVNGKDSFELMTSGSTGKPKKIKLLRKQLERSARLTIEKLQLSEKDHALICLNTAYIAGVMMLIRSLEANMKMTVIQPTSRPFLSDREEEDLTFTALVPMQVKLTLTNSEKEYNRFNKLKKIVIGGAPIDNFLKEQLINLQPEIYGTYGMTETVSHIALKRLNGIRRQGFFQTLKDVNIKIDERGCLVINGPMTMGKSIITNDLVEIIDLDKFNWIGRYDSIINSGGVKIQAEKLEEITVKKLIEMGEECRAVIMGIPDKLLGEKVCLFIERNDSDEEFLNELTKKLKQSLGKFEMPKVIRCVNQFPETPTGKIDKKKLIYI